MVVMGPSSTGKSTLGTALAASLNAHFMEGDNLHPPENLAKMRAGIALDDVDRRPFLNAVSLALASTDERGLVITCSALKRRYRDFIRSRVRDEVIFVCPLTGRDALATRLATRSGHFMPASLLDSQLADFEPPEPNELAVIVDGTADTEVQVSRVLAELR